MKSHGIWESVRLVAVGLVLCSVSALAQGSGVLSPQRMDPRGGLSVPGPERKENIKINFPGSPVLDVLACYQELSHQPVYLSLDVQARFLKTQAKVTVVTTRLVSSDEARALIRKALVDSCGVEVRDNGAGEILISEPPPAIGKPAATSP